MEIVFTSILAFASTNIDDLFLLTLFFGNRKYKALSIVAGQYLGITTLIAISVIGSLVGYLIDPHYVGLLGCIPVYLGIRGLRQTGNKPVEDAKRSRDRATSNFALAVAGITIANGGDNIGVYIPLFSGLDWIDKTSMIIIFLLMTLVWCIAARYFTRHPFVAKNIDRYGHRITPLILIGLGFYIFYENQVFSSVSNWLSNGE